MVKNGTVDELITPLSHQDIISPYYIYIISCMQVMRNMGKNVNYGMTN